MQQVEAIDPAAMGKNGRRGSGSPAKRHGKTGRGTASSSGDASGGPVEDVDAADAETSEGVHESAGIDTTAIEKEKEVAPGPEKATDATPVEQVKEADDGGEETAKEHTEPTHGAQKEQDASDTAQKSPPPTDQPEKKRGGANAGESGTLPEERRDETAREDVDGPRDGGDDAAQDSETMEVDDSATVRDDEAAAIGQSKPATETENDTAVESDGAAIGGNNSEVSDGGLFIIIIEITNSSTLKYN